MLVWTWCSGMSRQVGDGEAQSDYGVRRFRPDDVDDLLALYREVFDGDRDREWFAWKYEENPYVYHVPVFVAETAGELVGARPFFALELSVNGRRHLALQPGDTMVHPDHRGRGLFGRMNEAAIDQYSDRDASFFFAFPDEGSAAGYLERGWRRVADQPTYYRVQDPAGLRESSSAWASLGGRALKPLLDGYNRLSTHRLSTPEAVTVERYDSVPSAMLAGIEYDRRRKGIHVHRDVRFYDWRFRNPAREYAAYVAERGGEPVAGLVAATSEDGATVRLTDVTPLPTGDDHAGLEALLHRVVREYDDAGVVVAPPVFPEGLARRAGFRRDDRRPLSAVTSRTTHVVRGLSDGWTVDGLDITDADNWQLTFAEGETS